jgi:cytochrome bd-type quinol oxidase subunit 1
MPNAGLAETYFIVGMMVLILIVGAAAVYLFIKTYRKEVREKEARKEKQKAKQRVAEE